MKYDSQEEHDHFEGAMEQSVPQEPIPHNERVEETIADFFKTFGKKEIGGSLWIQHADAEKKVKDWLRTTLSTLATECEARGRAQTRKTAIGDCKKKIEEELHRQNSIPAENRGDAIVSLQILLQALTPPTV